MDIVIKDTVRDLPRLLTITPQERMAWWRSLGTLEREQLVRACGIVIGLNIGMAIVEGLEKGITRGKVNGH